MRAICEHENLVVLAYGATVELQCSHMELPHMRAICEHNQIKSQCKECGRSSIRERNRQCIYITSRSLANLSVYLGWSTGVV